MKYIQDVVAYNTRKIALETVMSVELLLQKTAHPGVSGNLSTDNTCDIHNIFGIGLNSKSTWKD